MASYPVPGGMAALLLPARLAAQEEELPVARLAALRVGALRGLAEWKVQQEPQARRV